MVRIGVSRVIGLADWWPDPKPSSDNFPDYIKKHKKAKRSSNELNMSDCLPLIECMLQGIIIEVPFDMMFENIGFHAKFGDLIRCSHTGYPVIERHDKSQYKNQSFRITS